MTRGRARSRLGYAALLVSSLGFAASCDSSYPLEIRVVLPEDDDALDRADNAALVLLPEGITANYDVDGTSFSVALEVEPDDLNRAVELYLARGAELLAWGRSAVFVTQAPSEDLAMFLGRPGALSTYPGSLDAPDPDVLAAEAVGRGIIILGSAGETFLFSAFTLTADAAQTLDPADGAPDPADGALVSDSGGGVVRVTWNESLTGYRFDPGADDWSRLTIAGAGDIGPRAGASHLVDAGRDWLLLFGGGSSRDIVQLALVPDDDDGSYAASALPGITLTDPRVGARARWITRTGSDTGEGIVLAGTASDTTPALELIPAETGDDDPAGAVPFALGPLGPWDGLDCAQLDIAETANETATIRVLCAGGVRGDQPTADGLLLKLPPTPWDAADADALVEELPAILQEPMAAPHWFADASAVYAQHDGRWLTLPRDTLEASITSTPALRALGGHSVKLSTGATFLLGGETTEGKAVDRWQVFTPAVGSAE